GFRKAFSFEPVIKTSFDLLKHLAVWQQQVSNKKSKEVLITGSKLKAFRNPQPGWGAVHKKAPPQTGGAIR
ncbi:hypothetical protein ACUODF_29745, partial [Escherichia coli]